MAASLRQRPAKVRTTVRLPRALYDEVHRLLDQGAASAETFNDFFISAVQTYLRMLRRRRIDAAFAEMAKDSDYQREAQAITEEFASNDWEALQIAERER